MNKIYFGLFKSKSVLLFVGYLKFLLSISLDSFVSIFNEGEILTFDPQIIYHKQFHYNEKMVKTTKNKNFSELLPHFIQTELKFGFKR